MSRRTWRSSEVMTKDPRCADCPMRTGGSCILSDLKGEDLHPYAGGISLAIYQKGEILLDRHSKTGCYILCQGRAKLYRRIRQSKRLLIKILTPRDVIAVEALARETWYDITVQALEEVEVCCIRQAEFHALLERHAPLKEQVLKRLAADHLELQRVMIRVSPYLGVKERLAVLLLQLSYDRRLAVSRGGGGLITLELSERELAEMIASHRVTVTKSLNELVERGWIRHVDHQIQIIDEEALKNLIADLWLVWR